jgi:two-component system, NarL family, invasion response regulator UvrY
MIRILIADDHSIVREGVKSILANVPDVVVAAEACNGNEVLEKVRNETVDLVILDITMPGRSGLEVLKQLKIEYPNLPVLILSMHPEEQYGMRVLKAGADGYLTKEAVPEELLSAIRKLKQGRKYIPPKLAERLAGNLSRTGTGLAHQALSDREYEVLCGIGKGKTVSEIASELHLGASTVATYRIRILEKLNLRTNADLTYYAIKQGLVD